MCSFTGLSAADAALQEYYGKVLQSTKDLKTSACTAAGKPHPLLRSLMERLPEEVQSRFYGCGVPVPLGIQGLRVLDLGSGSGRDCYLSAALVGEAGSVTGIDMTEEQLQVSWLCPICASVHHLCLYLDISSTSGWACYLGAACRTGCLCDRHPNQILS